MILYIPFYNDKNSQRASELRTCLQGNLKNPFIEKVVLLSEDNISINLPKCEKVKLPTRPTFSDLLKAANERTPKDGISIISNADIQFGDSLQLALQMPEDTCYALSRWDKNDRGEWILFDRADSQDSFIFKGKIKEINLAYPLGFAGIDNRLLRELEQVGYKISNPSQTIKTYHIHESGVRNYIVEGKVVDRVPPPYKLIPTSKMENKNLKRVLHISLNCGQTAQIAIQKSLQSIGEYKEILWHKIMREKGVAFLRKHIIDVSEQFNPDITFMQLQSPEPIDVETARKLKGFVISFSGDVRSPLPDFYITLGKEIDLTLFSNYSDVETMREHGCNANFMPAGFAPEYYYPIEQKEIVFFANNYKTAFPLSPFRNEIGNKLKEVYGSRFGLYGAGWDNADENLFNNPTKEGEILRHSKIAINISQFNSKRYSSDRLQRALGSGTLVLTHRFDDCDKLLTDGEHWVVWDDYDDLTQKIDYYLSHEEERAKIAKHGCEYAHKHLTWDKVLQVVKDCVNKKNDKQLIEAIKNCSKKGKYSQTNEEEVLEVIFNHIGTTNKYLVDFGAGDGVHLSNSALLREQGWGYLLMDGDNHGNPIVKKEWITAENICDLFEKHQVPKEFDLLSIDTDGNDYWILKALLSKYSPRVFVCEFNPAITVGEAKTIKYNPSHQWENDTYYGASWEAFKLLGKEYGYTLVGQCSDLNMFFVKSDIVPQKEFNLSYKQRFGHKHNTTGEWVDLLKEKKEIPILMPYQQAPFNNDNFVASEFICLRDKFKIKTAIETGTAMGGSTKFFAENFERVYTVEINKTYQDYAKDFVGNKSNVSFLLGNSPDMLRQQILSEVGNDSIWFLDAHWSTSYCPLQDELTAIAESGIKPVIAIHDFKNSGDERFGYDSINGQPFTFEWLKPNFDKIYGEDNYEYYFNTGYCEDSAKRGIVYLTPKI